MFGVILWVFSGVGVQDIGVATVSETINLDFEDASPFPAWVGRNIRPLTVVMPRSPGVSIKDLLMYMISYMFHFVSRGVQQPG